MKKIMAVLAHPDDEGAVGGTLYQYSQNDTETILVCGTRGEVGQISDPALATPETLGTVRQRELEEACAILNIQQLEFLGYRDSGMVDTPENADPRALINADETDFLARMVALFQQYQPDIVITFEPYGWYGHPDHQAVSRWVTQAFERTQKQVQSPLANSCLFHSVIPFSKFGAMIQQAIEAGYLEAESMGGVGDDMPIEELLKTEAKVTHVIDIAPLYDLIEQARAVHRTQFPEDHFFQKIPREMLQKALSTEQFIQVYPPPADGASGNRVADLFVVL